MLVMTAHLLEAVNGPVALRNALTESFVLHARALIDFFYPPIDTRTRRPRPPKRDDLLAEDFLPLPYQWTLWRGRPRGMPVVLRRAHRRAHKRLAHITTSRGRYARNWPKRQIVEAILSAMEVFNAISDVKLRPV